MLKKLHLYRLRAFPAVFLFIFIISTFAYVNKFFKDVNLWQILFLINTPIRGADTRLIRWFLERCIYLPILYTLIVCYLPELNFLKLKSPFKKISYAMFVSLLSLLLTVGYFFYKTDIRTAKQFFSNETTTFYDENFADPGKAEISFNQKKNLIILHVESLEATFKNKTFFGQNLLSDLESMEAGNVQFSNFQNGFATDFTQGSVIALFTGMPAKYSWFVNKIGNEQHFFHGYYSLGKILKDNGYHLASIQGTDGNFSGLEDFLRDNDFLDITDLDTIKKDYPQHEQNGTWGYSDDDIFQIAKDKIKQLEQKKPYFLYIQTIDTHFGYEPKITQYPNFDNVYYNVIHNTELSIADFLEWLKQNADWENTVIAIVGDHLRMGNDFPMPSKRSIYNLFINSEKPQDLNRTFSQIDLFPSVVEAMGGNIKNHRLGLGTSVFSKQKTLAEKYSDEFLRETLAKRSELYEKMFMQ